MTAGGGERVKQSKLLIGCYWQNRDGLERSKAVFNLKDEWTPRHSAHGMWNISGLSAAVLYLCRRRRDCVGSAEFQK